VRPRILHVYYATYGTAGAYVAALAEAFRDIPVDVTFAVSAYYRFPIDRLPPNVRVAKHFFRLTENVPENPRVARKRLGLARRARLALRYAELVGGYARLLAWVVRHRIGTVNLALVDDYAPTWLFARAVKMLGRRLLITAHDVVAHDRPDIPPSRRAMFAMADRIVVHGEHVAALLANKSGVRRERVEVHTFPWCDVRSVLDPARLGDERRAVAERFGAMATTVVAPGYIRRTKGFDRLVDAWLAGLERDSGLHLIVAGDPAPDVRADLARLAAARNVTIDARRLDDEEHQALLEQADLVVLPYREYAHSSVHLNAYLSAERPVIAADIALFRSDIGPDVGFVAATDPPAGFATAIRTAAASGRARLREMGRRGRDHFATRLGRLPAELGRIYLDGLS
jgi:glycosyltransferase involved in cell wall biosynthesis